MQQRMYSEQVGGNWGLPAGYLQAATEPGRNLARGMEQAGNSIANAIKEYRQHKEEREFLDGRLESLVPRIQALYENGNRMDPSSESSQMAVKLAKYSSLSNAQKKGLLLGAEQYIARDEKERDRMDRLSHEQKVEQNAASYLALAQKGQAEGVRQFDITSKRQGEDSLVQREQTAALIQQYKNIEDRLKRGEAQSEQDKAKWSEGLANYNAGPKYVPDFSKFTPPTYGAPLRPDLDRMLAQQSEAARQHHALQTPGASPAVLGNLISHWKALGVLSDPIAMRNAEANYGNMRIGQREVELREAQFNRGSKGSPIKVNQGPKGTTFSFNQTPEEHAQYLRDHPPVLSAAEEKKEDRIAPLQRELELHDAKIAAGDKHYGFGNFQSRETRRSEILGELDNLRRKARPTAGVDNNGTRTQPPGAAPLGKDAPSIPTPQTKEDYDKLPAGTYYYLPGSTIRRIKR